MPMTAEQYAELIDQVWADVESSASPERYQPELIQGIERSRLFHSIGVDMDQVPDSKINVICIELAHALLMGIAIGKAIREVEELEGLGR
jgi:hypothetical protein